jgi:1,4-alpha-glucan branching enzyme
MGAFSSGFKTFGLLAVAGGISYREWAPGASALALIGDFNCWDRGATPCARDAFGVWSVFLPHGPDGVPAIKHGTRVKVAVTAASGERMDRLPAWSTYQVQGTDGTVSYSAVFWNPPPSVAHVWRHPRRRCLGPADGGGLKIYEAHVGMASERGVVASYADFARDVLPRVVDAGYNCVQLMAIMEHAYYASFGYHVTGFFAASSRFGTPDELKALVDRAHELGLSVIMDVVHSHASKNVQDGINNFDGTDHQYFHSVASGRGEHPLWDSRLFDYGAFEVMRFLLSNLRWWIDEYRFDGFRFDGVTSMLYSHHGSGVGFSGSYDDYFGPAVDGDAVAYLTLANALLHDPAIISPPALTVAEDVSGMPTLCRPTGEGGLGFDYRLGMAIPDEWIKIVKERTDGAWDLGGLVHTLTNRRHAELTIAYAESHDQALVGDKTLAFRLMDAEMYSGMSVLQPASPVIARGIALHKIIRLLTSALGGEAYLNFMGNEFGHPEWIDFPREGNGNSYHYCRRQWSLADNSLLRYSHLLNFDRAMNALEAQYQWLAAGQAGTYVSLKHESDQVIVFDKAGLVFVINLHPSQSYSDYRIGAPAGGDYVIALDSDAADMGGHARLDPACRFPTVADPWHDRPFRMSVYTPCRTCVVYAPAASVKRAVTAVGGAGVGR